MTRYWFAVMEHDDEESFYQRGSYDLEEATRIAKACDGCIAVIREDPVDDARCVDVIRVGV